MSLKKKFGDKEVDKKIFYSSKQAISLDSVDLDKISIKIKDPLFTYRARLVNILDFILKFI